VILPRPGRRNLITDVPGLRVGNATDEAVRTGVTVVTFEQAWTASVDIRGGGPGVRETAALDPENLVGKAHAIVMAGGSVYGLGAADGVVAALASRGVGMRIKPNSPPIPIVPAAVIHDLANGGDKDWKLTPPYRDLGIAALEATSDTFDLGSVGAGRGAMAGLIKGGLGSASIDLGEGLIVGALVTGNPVGSVKMPGTEVFWAWPFEQDDEFGGLLPTRRPDTADPVPDESRLEKAGRLTAGANTTLGIIATNANLTNVECRRVAIMAQDGLARAVRPAHTPFDGDLVFAAASGELALSDTPERAAQIARIGSAAADCLARAIARGIWLAT